MDNTPKPVDPCGDNGDTLTLSAMPRTPCETCGRQTRRTFCGRCRAAFSIPGLDVIDGAGEPSGDPGDTVWSERYLPPVPESRR